MAEKPCDYRWCSIGLGNKKETHMTQIWPLALFWLTELTPTSLRATQPQSTEDLRLK